ncbi:hypothetical protein [Rickettsia helvetica]|nr:hypothetical protein [Rickettsia helvetica]
MTSRVLSDPRNNAFAEMTSRAFSDPYTVKHYPNQLHKNNLQHPP